MFTLPSNRRDLLQMVLALDVTLQQRDLAPERRARLLRFQRVLTARGVLRRFPAPPTFRRVSSSARA